MRRFFLRPLLDFHQPFFPFNHISAPAFRIKFRNVPLDHQNTGAKKKDNDPHQLFQQFFKENQLKNQTEKEFFQKHFPQKGEKVENVFDPFKVLEINKNATIDQIKEAYRTLAIKYHPKNGSTPQTQAKFAEVAKAYETVMESKKNRDFGDLGLTSFFEDFENEVEKTFNTKKQEGNQKESGVTSPQNTSNHTGFGDLYSQSSHYESINGQQTKYVVQKVYKKDGKLLTVKRQEKLKDDGNLQITQTINNGKQTKKKTFTQEKDVKKIAA